jgi:hypothetical protein
VSCGAAGCPVQPASEQVPFAERAGLARQQYEHILEGILGGVLVAQHAPADAQDVGPCRATSVAKAV